MIPLAAAAMLFIWSEAGFPAALAFTFLFALAYCLAGGFYEGGSH